MSKILIIIPCGQGKIWDKHPEVGQARARDAYTGAPFKVNRAYAEHFSNHWLILSAKYGFISPEFLIPEPYNVTFKKQSTKPVSVSVLRDQIRSQGLDSFEMIIGLGGIEYRKMIEAAYTGYKVKINFPFAGLSLGMGMQAIKKAIGSNELGINDNRPDRSEVLTFKEINVAKNHLQKSDSANKGSEQSDSPDIEVIWNRIINHQREIFQQIRGGEFTYVIRGNAIIPDKTNVPLTKGVFKKALERYPLTSTVAIRDLTGPSYVYAILMDNRICKGGSSFLN